MKSRIRKRLNHSQRNYIFDIDVIESYKSSIYIYRYQQISKDILVVLSSISYHSFIRTPLSFNFLECLYHFKHYRLKWSTEYYTTSMIKIYF